jgi:hypothetical protein
MAVNESLIQLKGKVAGLIFYRAYGENLVRAANVVSRERIMTSPEFERTRENMVEFGGASQVAKAFRTCFKRITKEMGISCLSGKVTGLMRKLCSEGTGIRGQRAFLFSEFPELIRDFEFNPDVTFASSFFVPHKPITFSPDRNVVSWNIPAFNTVNGIHAPLGATHFKLILAIGILSNYCYNINSDRYEPIVPELNTCNRLVQTPELELNGLIPTPILLSVNLDTGSPLPQDVVVLAATGILFYQRVNNRYYALANRNALSLNAVG